MLCVVVCCWLLFVVGCCWLLVVVCCWLLLLVVCCFVFDNDNLCCMLVDSDRNDSDDNTESSDECKMNCSHKDEDQN